MGKQEKAEIEAGLWDRRMGTLRKNAPRQEKQSGTQDGHDLWFQEEGWSQQTVARKKNPSREYSQKVGQGENPNFPASSDMLHQGVRASQVVRFGPNLRT